MKWSYLWIFFVCFGDPFSIIFMEFSFQLYHSVDYHNYLNAFLFWINNHLKFSLM
uniref:Uncharacterized protein n=1 Tax=Anguilla anguilla TaxID=7936 RepID=A0A0E9SNY7_ANGAN